MLNVRFCQFICKRKMTGLFTQILNPMTGVSEWASRESNYDYHQEVARSAFGDMLHDGERNQKYFAAIRSCISKLHADGKEAHVLDIGTGTAILSMMAVAAGADSVTACEAFLPMANCAEKIIKANGLENKIRLIKKRSTDISVGGEGNLSKKANVLVAELLDTELIGEGAIDIYNHAHMHLLTEDVICIPSKGSCYAQIVESPLAAEYNKTKLLPNLDGKILLTPPKAISECKGEAAVHDMQMNQIPRHLFQLISKPVSVFDFDFSSKVRRETRRKANFKVSSLRQGSADMVFFWWEIQMDEEGKINLSCAPYWAHPDYQLLAKSRKENIPEQNTTPWRDHWMQAIYYLPKPLWLEAPQTEFNFSANHDEYSFWFEVRFADDEPKQDGASRHSCSCNLHRAYSRNRIGQINQSTRNKVYIRHLEKEITSNAHILSLSDGSLVGLATSKLGAASTICYEPHRLSRDFIKLYANHNQCKNVRIISDLDNLQASDWQCITHVVAEPYFITSILPWDNFYFGFLINKLKKKLPKILRITPNSAKIFAVPVEFLDLHKIRAPLGSCEGFDLTIFDEMISESSLLADAVVEAQPLWEYPNKALGKEQEIFNINFENFLDIKQASGTIPIKEFGSCNGIALWVDWDLDGSKSTKSTVTTGPTKPIIIGEYIHWDVFNKQGVHLVIKPKKLKKNQSAVHWEAHFKPATGELKFNFKVVV